MKERHDPFNEKEIFYFLTKYNVDTVISYGATVNFNLMLLKNRIPLNHFSNIFWQQRNKTPNYNRLAFISQRYPLNEYQFNYFKNLINTQLESLNSFHYKISEYKVIFSKELDSSTGFEFSRKNTWEKTSGLYFNIIEKKNSPNDR